MGYEDDQDELLDLARENIALTKRAEAAEAESEARREVIARLIKHRAEITKSNAGFHLEWVFVASDGLGDLACTGDYDDPIDALAEFMRRTEPTDTDC